MKTIIAGGREIAGRGNPHNIYKDLFTIFSWINKCPWLDEITEVICGKARGVDTAGELWAVANRIHVEPFYANWDIYGKAAGHIRNEEMAKYGDGLILVWDGQSSGSASMLKYADRYGLRLHVKEL